jgi:hypothetical protein
MPLAAMIRSIDLDVIVSTSPRKARTRFVNRSFKEAKTAWALAKANAV